MTLEWTTIWTIALLFPMTLGAQKLEKLPASVNTSEYDEFAPVMNIKADRLYFTREGAPEFDRTLIYGMEDLNKTLPETVYFDTLAAFFSAMAGQTITDPVSSDFNQDIWYVELKGMAYGRVVHPGFPLNNAMPNSAGAYLENPDRLILINQFPQAGGIDEGISAIEVKENGSYSIAQPIFVRHFYNLSSEMSFSMTPDGQMMVFAIEKADSRGSLDLYMTVKRSNGTWGPPSNLEELNSPAREVTPFLSPDKERLFFASDRDGDLDIYMSERSGRDYFEWEKPVKLPSPVNSPSPDYQPYLDPVREHLYFVSTRDGTSDIFRYHIRKPEIPVTERKPVQGRIVDDQTRDVVPGSVYYHPMGDGEKPGFFRSATGYFEVNPTYKGGYRFYASIEGYESDTTYLPNNWQDGEEVPEVIIHLTAGSKTVVVEVKSDEVELTTDPEIEVEVNEPVEEIATVDEEVADVDTTVQSMGVNEEVKVEKKETKPKRRQIKRPPLSALQVNNVLFERTTARFLSESMGDLNRLFRTMRDYPKLEIIVAGHTDDNGTDDILYELSIRRANAVKNYLTSRGIDKDRIAIAGFGGQKPVHSNETAYGRRLNRRVEVRILDK